MVQVGKRYHDTTHYFNIFLQEFTYANHHFYNTHPPKKNKSSCGQLMSMGLTGGPLFLSCFTYYIVFSFFTRQLSSLHAVCNQQFYVFYCSVTSKCLQSGARKLSYQSFVRVGAYFTARLSYVSTA